MNKLTHGQKQKRLGFSLAVILFVVLLLAFGGELLKLQSFYTPDIPGYFKSPPSGSYTPIAWSDVVKATSRAGDNDFPDALKKLDGHQVKLSGYMFPNQKPDRSIDKTPVNSFLLAAAITPYIGVGCGSGPQSPVGVKLTTDTTVAYTDWPFRVYGTLKLDPNYRGSGADVSIRDAIAVLGK